MDSKNIRFLIGQFLVFLCTGSVIAIALMWSGFLNRQELQLINVRFEARPWLLWKPESIKRLDFDQLNRIRQTTPGHSWDYALSWLIENNHPDKINNVVLFNRQPEDEPPLEAIKMHSWMEPLKHYPLPRSAVAEMVDFLHKAKARMIILDNDFPQYSEDDARLADSIYRATNDKGNETPVLFARTINRRTSDRVLFESEPTMPYGVLQQLQKLEPTVDVKEKYTALPCALEDEDQVVRRLLVRFQTAKHSKPTDSLAAKAVALLERAQHKQQPQTVPNIIDIDYSAPPNSSIYPVRPLWYLLDPDMQSKLQNPPADWKDTTINGSVVIIGDSIVDVFSTPLTNLGVEQMSGSEILAHSIETLARRSWPTRLDGSRLDGPFSMFYAIMACTLSAVVWIAFKVLQKRTSPDAEIAQTSTAKQLKHMGIDLLVLGAIIAFSVVAACGAFVWGHALVPVVVPALSIAAGGLAASLWEREKANEQTLKIKLAAAQANLQHAQQKYETDLKRQEAEAKAREILADQHRRKEFVRRINHDLNAPVSVMNWTLVEMQEVEIESSEIKEKVELLTKNSDRLCELIDQLVQSYDYGESNGDSDVKGSSNGDGTSKPTGSNGNGAKEVNAEVFDLTQLLRDCVSLQKPLADVCKSRVEFSGSTSTVIVTAEKLAITRIFDNLVRNALKHNQEGTAVTLKLTTTGEQCTVEVIDDGKGISSENLSKIFESGFRIDPSSSGQGLGLNIVKTLVESVGGTISVRSEVGKGTTFEVTLKTDTNNCAEATDQETKQQRTGEGTKV